MVKAGGGGTQRAQLAKNSLLNLVGQILPLLIAVIALPVVVKGLGNARFGLLTLAWTFLGYFNFFDLGLGRAATRFIASALGRGETERVPEVLVTALLTQLLFGTLAALAMVVASPWLVHAVLDEQTLMLSGEALTVLRSVALGMPIVMVSSSLSGALEAAQRFDLVNLIRVPVNTASFAIPLAGVLMGLSLPVIVLLLLAGRAVALSGYLFFVRRTIGGFGLQHARVALLRDMLSFGGWIMVSGLTVPTLAYAERLLIASSLGIAALTHYALPFEIVSRSAVLPAALALTLFPAFSFFESATDAQLKELYGRPIRYLLVALAPVLLLFLAFAHDILLHWLGAEMAAASTDVLRLLALAFFLNGVAQVGLAAVQGLGRPDLKARLDIVEVPLFIVLALVLIPRFGITGAAAAKLIVTMVDAAGIFYLVGVASRHRIHGVLPSLAGLLTTSAVYVAAGSFALHYPLPLAVRVLLFAALSIAYFAIVWQRFTDERDRAALARGLEIARSMMTWKWGTGRA